MIRKPVTFPCFVFSGVEGKSCSKEKTRLISNEIQRNAKGRKKLISLLLLGIIVELVGICSLLVFKSRDVKRPLIWVPLSILIVGLLGTCVFLSKQPQSQQQLWFKVPLLPWLPVLALFFNIYLIMELKPLTWVRFVVWMAIGKLTTVILPVAVMIGLIMLDDEVRQNPRKQ